MGKRSKILSSIAVAAVFLSASPANADHEGIAVYRTTMYSDATRTEVVGSIDFNYCTYYNQTDSAQYSLSGTYTMYQEDSLVGYCSQWNYLPIH